MTEEPRPGIDFTGITVVFACHDGEGNYLFSKRSQNCRDEHGTWDLGGGRMEFDDTPENTLRKEIAEEYCTEVLEFEFLGFRDAHREHAGVRTHWIGLDYRVRIDREKVRNGEPHKLEEIAWFRMDALPSPLHSQFPRFFELHKDKLN